MTQGRRLHQLQPAWEIEKWRGKHVVQLSAWHAGGTRRASMISFFAAGGLATIYTMNSQSPSKDVCEVGVQLLEGRVCTQVCVWGLCNPRQHVLGRSMVEVCSISVRSSGAQVRSWLPHLNDRNVVSGQGLKVSDRL